MVYHSIGTNSVYQPEEKASCRADTYPATTTLTVMDKKGKIYETINISDGEPFTIGVDYDLDSETHFDISDYGDYFIHTSCSVPLVPGDQIGPFFVYAGNDCTYQPQEPECIVPDKASYTCGEAITVSWDLSQSDDGTGTAFSALMDDWIGIYACDVTADKYYHAELWKWSCGSNPNQPACTATTSGNIVFDSLPSYNSNGPHSWPIAPYIIAATGEVNTCFKAVILRNDGPSVPPYVGMCESTTFEILADDTVAGCSVRPSSPVQPAVHDALETRHLVM